MKVSHTLLRAEGAIYTPNVLQFVVRTTAGVLAECMRPHEQATV